MPESRASSESSSNVQKVFRLGWKAIIIIVGALLLIIIAISWYWYHDERDLTDVMARAKANGIAISFEGLGLVKSSTVRLERWNRLSALSKDVQSYSRSNRGSSDPQLKLFAPVPPEIRHHHDNLDIRKLDELLNLVDAMNGEILIVRDYVSLMDKIPEIEVERNLVSLFRERIALAEPGQLSREVRRMLACVSQCNSFGVISYNVKRSLAEEAWGAITCRLADLRALDQGIPDIIDKICSDLSRDLDNGLTADFIAVWNLARLSDGHGGRISLTAIYGTSNSMPSDWGSMDSLTMRFGRGPLLHIYMDWIINFRTITDPLTILRLSRDANYENLAPKFNILARRMFGVLAISYAQLLSAHFRTIMHGHLLSAEMRGKPWPEDNYDPSHHILRAIVRDGHIMGAYSLGWDGIDHKGLDSNKYWPLYGPINP